jgi:hypothetical protein
MRVTTGSPHSASRRSTAGIGSSSVSESLWQRPIWLLESEVISAAVSMPPFFLMSERFAALSW